MSRAAAEPPSALREQGVPALPGQGAQGGSHGSFCSPRHTQPSTATLSLKNPLSLSPPPHFPSAFSSHGPCSPALAWVCPCLFTQEQAGTQHWDSVQSWLRENAPCSSWLTGAVWAGCLCSGCWGGAWICAWQRLHPHHPDPPHHPPPPPPAAQAQVPLPHSLAGIPWVMAPVLSCQGTATGEVLGGGCRVDWEELGGTGQFLRSLPTQPTP